MGERYEPRVAAYLSTDSVQRLYSCPHIDQAQIRYVRGQKKPLPCGGGRAGPNSTVERPISLNLCVAAGLGTYSLAAMMSPRGGGDHSRSATTWWCETRSSQRLSACRAVSSTTASSQSSP